MLNNALALEKGGETVFGKRRPTEQEFFASTELSQPRINPTPGIECLGRELSSFRASP
ncbi:hypothetical protein [Pararhodobacter sp.]|uniref:hypothetical protein n=1 Tax=Pararhodobacter sp. TaxID=2127056 RepID=UPI002AFE866F|nr:hypothetical protein [Pararhodobacter sp.]